MLKGKYRSIISILSAGSIPLPHNSECLFILRSFSQEVVPCVLRKRDAPRRLNSHAIFNVAWSPGVNHLIRRGCLVFSLNIGAWSYGVTVQFRPSTWHGSLPFLQLRYSALFLQCLISPLGLPSTCMGQEFASSCWGIPHGPGLMTT